MSSTSTDVNKRCTKCLNYANVYITCFKCDSAYHSDCWKQVPGAHLNQNGQLFCCRGLTSNYADIYKNFGTQGNPLEKAIEKENVDGYKEDLENYPIKEEGSKWNEFKCDACRLEFMTREHLENHYSRCPNKAGELIQEMKDEKDLDDCLHKEEDLEWNEFQCGACLLEFTNIRHLENHYSECPNTEGESIQELNEDRDLENELLKEENSEPNELKCDTCSLEFMDKEYLESDSSECPNEHGGSLPCLEKDKAGLFRSFHNQENFQNEFEQYLKQCNASSSYSRSDKNSGINITNTRRDPTQLDDKEEKYKQNECEYSPCRKGDLVNRTCTHTAARKEVLKKYKCKDCEYSTHKKIHLVTHMRIHTSERPFKCDLCDYASTQKDSLELHRMAKHYTIQGYKCRHCEYSCYTKYSILEHKRTHMSEKQCKCQLCDYAAAEKRNLEVHVIVKHSKMKTVYKCPYCKYFTYTKANLVIHIHTHTKEKLFKCDLCDYAGAQKETLNSHILEKHSNPPHI